MGCLFGERAWVLVSFCAVVLPGCGAQTSTTSEPATQSEGASEALATAPPTADDSADGDEGEGRSASPELAEEGAKKPTAAPPEGPRELTYHVRPGALVIEVDSVEFDARATAVRVGRGWGVEVKVEATLRGGGSRSLLNPSHGPLAFAGKARDQSFTDEREGDAEQVLTSAQPLTLSRTWPEGDVKPLSTGQSLELSVGLWGLGRDAKNRQAIRQFFTVNMKAGKKKPTPVVAPPEVFMNGG